MTLESSTSTSGGTLDKSKKHFLSSGRSLQGSVKSKATMSFASVSGRGRKPRYPPDVMTWLPESVSIDTRDGSIPRSW